MKNAFFLLFLVLGIHTIGQSDRLSAIQETVEFLASDELRGRKTGTVYSEQSLDFISKKIKKACGKKLRKQKFEVILGTNAPINATNGYIFFNNKKDSTILISAHYDHIGMGGNLSKTPGKIEIHNGADDNASGVALLIDLASELLKIKVHKYNFMIVFFDAHEIGLFGSKIFMIDLVQDPKNKPIAYQINFDMVGRLNKEEPKIKVTCTPALQEIVDNTITLEHYYGESNMLLKLDTQYATEIGIPCINISTGIHADYHTPSDDAKYINYEGIVTISDQIKIFIANL